MLEPKKPIKPKCPVAPLKYVSIRNIIYIDEESYTIQDLLNAAGKDLTAENLVFEGCYYPGNDYGDNSGYGLTPYYVTIQENFKYESQKKKYDIDLETYNKSMESFNLKQAEYEFELKKYEAWLNSKEVISTKAALAKAEAEVKKLKKKLKIK